MGPKKLSLENIKRLGAMLKIGKAGKSLKEAYQEKELSKSAEHIADAIENMPVYGKPAAETLKKGNELISGRTAYIDKVVDEATAPAEEESENLRP